MPDGVVQIPIAEESKNWFDALVANGLVYYDSQRHFIVRDNVRDVIKALHTVLAGGKVSITTVDPGDTQKSGMLDGQFDKAIDQTNMIIGDHGSDVANP